MFIFVLGPYTVKTEKMPNGKKAMTVIPIGVCRFSWQEGHSSRKTQLPPTLPSN